MLRVVTLYTSGGTDPFTDTSTTGSPITGNGYNYQVLQFRPSYSRLMIFVTGLSGTNPSITFTVGNPYGSNTFTLPPITSPQYIYVVAEEDGVSAVFLNTNWQVQQVVKLSPFNIFENGVSVSWSVGGTSPSIEVYIDYEFEDGGNE